MPGHWRRLAKALLISYTDAYDFAQIGVGEVKPVPYGPDHTDWRQRRLDDPAQYWRQGLTIGIVERAAEALIVRTAGVPPRLATWGEFENGYYDKSSAISRAFVGYVDDIYLGFHPRSRPVLWRVLIGQTQFWRALAAFEDVTARQDVRRLKPVQLIPCNERTHFDWRSAADRNVPDSDVLDAPFAVADVYIHERVPDLIRP